MKSTSYLDVMKPEDISIAHCWLQFAGFVLPPSASALQREEMRKAFFAGFTECFKVVNDVSVTLTEAQATATLDRLNAEGNEFFDRMVKEYGR